MLVVGRRENQHVPVISLLDRPQEGVPPLDRLQLRFRHAKRQVDDLALPAVDCPVQCFDDRFDLAAALRPENVGREEPDLRRQSQDNVGDRRPVRSTLSADVRQRLGPVRDKDAAFDRLDDRPLSREFRFQGRPLDAAVEDATRTPAPVARGSRSSRSGCSSVSN